MIKHTLAVTTVLLLMAAQAIAGQVRSVADLKADLGFAERQVNPADLGLKDKEVLTARLFDGPLVKGKHAFDEKMLMMAIEGMINRHPRRAQEAGDQGRVRDHGSQHPQGTWLRP